jgi:hypothetical protein
LVFTNYYEKEELHLCRIIYLIIMTIDNTSTLLDSLEVQVEQHLLQAIRVFQNMDERTLMEPAANGGWSIAQCLWHLNSYGHFYLPQIAAGLEKSHAHNTRFKSSWLGAYFTRMMEPGQGSKKYKAFKDHVPPVELNAYAVVAEFIGQLELLHGYLKQARSKDLNSIKLPISISRWVKLKLGDVFQFIIAHNERHLQQAKRNLPAH